MGNVTDAMNKFAEGDFVGGGGWDSWLQITTNPQNNPMGAMILAEVELDARLAAKKEIQMTETAWGNGFMSFKDKDGKITTPGKEIVDQLGWAESSVIREMELATDLDAIFSALLNTLVNTATDYFAR